MSTLGWAQGELQRLYAAMRVPFDVVAHQQVPEGALLWALRRQTFQEIQHSQALDSIHTLNETLQAIEMLSQAIAIDPQNPLARFQKAQVLLSMVSSKQ